MKGSDCMAQYGSGLSYGQVASMEKERIKHALEGERCTGEDEDGFIWVSCSEDEARDEILSIFDECVYQCLEAMHASRALEKMLADKGYKIDIADYQKALNLTEIPDEYLFEGEEECEG